MPTRRLLPTKIDPGFESHAAYLDNIRSIKIAKPARPAQQTDIHYVRRKAGLPVQLKFAGECYPAFLTAATRSGCTIDLGSITIQPGGRALIELRGLFAVPVTVARTEAPYADLEIVSPLLASALMYALGDCPNVALQRAEGPQRARGVRSMMHHI